MVKKYLMTPGPTPVPAAVAAAQTAEMVSHRGREFHELYQYVAATLRDVFGTKHEVYLLTGSGTCAMEAAVANLLSPGEKVLVVRSGHFGNRWAEILKEYGAMVKTIDVEWGRAVNPKLVAERLAEDTENEIRAVFATFVDTSTGAVTDVEEIGRMVNETNALFVVDAVSGLGATDYRMDEWYVDVTLSASQKSFMSPPGIAFLALSPKAWKVCERAKCPRYYWDLRKYRQWAERFETPYTPAVATVRALATALELMMEEGLPNIYARHERLARATRAGVTALGLRLFAINPANVLTVVRPPDEIGADDLRDHIARNYGVYLAGGQGQLKDRVIRIAHMGFVGPFDVVHAITALEMGLVDKGIVLELGTGAAAAEEILKEL
ncbi:MAG: alanine--glyoxylate aminotransferase family protein [Candidatus Coatesbacteria bacterium]|nr:MAG: alanine--glyoxylate aminotransferase family protein [Candidatus Coatesbacteria bacterium]